MEFSGPLVTIYIPCRNYARYLDQSVNSVFEQLYENWELIIVDEGSTDDSYEKALSLSKKKPQKSRVLKNDQPLGLQKDSKGLILFGLKSLFLLVNQVQWLRWLKRLKFQLQLVKD